MKQLLALSIFVATLTASTSAGALATIVAAGSKICRTLAATCALPKAHRSRAPGVACRCGGVVGVVSAATPCYACASPSAGETCITNPVTGVTICR